MSGFEVRNEDNVIMINSDQRHTIFVDQRTVTLMDVGSIGGAMAFGNVNELGYLTTNMYPTPGYIHWIRLNAGAWCFPGAWMFKPNTAQMIRTSRTTVIPSGFLDVFDEAGNRIWSAAGAATMPKVEGIYQVPAGVDSGVQSIALPFNPWIPMSALPGNVSYDGSTTGWSGLSMRWTGSQLQFKWEKQNQKSYAQIFGGRGGIRIPYAQFPGR